METKEKPLIQAKKIEVEYEGVKVFSDLSFEIFDGDFVCIVGPNGAEVEIGRASCRERV